MTTLLSPNLRVHKHVKLCHLAAKYKTAYKCPWHLQLLLQKPNYRNYHRNSIGFNGCNVSGNCFYRPVMVMCWELFVACYLADGNQ